MGGVFLLGGCGHIGWTVREYIHMMYLMRDIWKINGLVVID